MDSTTSDFSKLLYRVDLIEDYSISLLELFPGIGKYPEYNEMPTLINSAKTFKYVVLMYDKESPLHIIDNITKKKTHAAVLSNFEKDKTGSIVKPYIDMMNGLNRVVNKWIIRYYKLMDDVSYSNMCVYKEKIHQQHEALMIETDADTISKIHKNISSLTDLYDESRKKFQQGDINTYGLNEEIRIGIEQEEIPTPESIAYSLREGKDPTLEWSAYGKNYNPVLTMGNVRHIYKPGDEIPPLKNLKK